MNFLARSGFLGAGADRERFGPLDAALVRDGGGHRQAALREEDRDPLADAGHDPGVPVGHRGEHVGHAVEARELRLEREGGLAQRRERRVVDVEGVAVAVVEAEAAHGRQVPVEVADLAGHSLLPHHAVGAAVGLAEMIGVVDQPEIAEGLHDRIEVAVQPVAFEVLEFGPEVVEGIVGRVHLVDEAGIAQLHDIFAVRVNDVVGAGRRLVHEREHLLAADIFLADDLDAVRRLEGLDDERVGVAGPAQIGERLLLCRGLPAGDAAGQCRGTGERGRPFHESTPRQAPAARVAVPHRPHGFLPLLLPASLYRSASPPHTVGVAAACAGETAGAATRARARLFGP